MASYPRRTKKSQLTYMGNPVLFSSDGLKVILVNYRKRCDSHACLIRKFIQSWFKNKLKREEIFLKVIRDLYQKSIIML